MDDSLGLLDSLFKLVAEIQLKDVIAFASGVGSGVISNWLYGLVKSSTSSAKIEIVVIKNDRLASFNAEGTDSAGVENAVTAMVKFLGGDE